MRIISKFKDYYDGGAMYGIDKERVYVRETKIISVDNIKSQYFDVLGFCGDIYILKNFSESSSTKEELKNSIFYNMIIFQRILKSIK
jgi:hypothetical protein